MKCSRDQPEPARAMEPRWLPPDTNYRVPAACKEELFRGGKLPWVLYLPINTSNS